MSQTMALPKRYIPEKDGWNPAVPEKRRRRKAGARPLGKAAASGKTRSKAMPVNEQSMHISLTMVAFALAALVTVALLLLNLVRYNELATIQKEIRQTTSDVEALKAETDSMAMRLEPYKDEARIEALAKSRLGMRKPTADQIVSITRDPAVQLGRGTSVQKTDVARLRR